MSHFMTGLFIQANSLDSALEQVTGLMQPYNQTTAQNPANAKWQTFNTNGGRWSQALLLNDNTRANHGLASTILFDGSPDVYDLYSQRWDRLTTSSSKYDADKKEQLLNDYASKQAYAKEQTRFIPHTFITPTGDWFETGKMNRFSLSDAARATKKAYQEQWDKAIQEFSTCYFILLDCND